MSIVKKLVSAYKHYYMTVKLYHGEDYGEYVSVELRMFPYASSKPCDFDEYGNIVTAVTNHLYTKDLLENFPLPFTPIPRDVIEEINDAFAGADCVHYVNIDSPDDASEVYRKYRMLFTKLI